ncbi:MAG: hypothetical protein A3G32_04820 [Deltaproteobacteria bacterium RIFCSPLOWO2_12_FULL_40_28]|nr:MAG: hypothetical protein A3C45_08930 [Deltaproteobacteria bacterium RIFCSPHIGHO2_02_FULL_40_28]OGQ19690.1 MAG: hypothetical protein A3E27_08125 [Deltaproteobacteria bacterium RIFCSPHIGHO2_12_FULL_40_32]OGQ40967.1 MAG: hypothetical protein A3I69_03540 [Deltaproteobacteria bacterium RIFCSPLOWO2_02_FULL_40_36]OGQ54082.1 MAG: hypothetical protein A3G32_04820 [Deltaproteobacteria bacterium RIFCSPLOWO2_12_FULL_40_28]
MLLEKLFQFGVLPRNAVKNYPSGLKDLLHKKLVQKASKKGRVFYELTKKALPLAEEYRLMLFHKTKLQVQLTPHAKFYRALLGELRFLNDKHPLALKYQLLGDWQLTRPVVPSQLKLAKLRYYQQQNLL